MYSRASGGRSFTGALKSQPCSRQTASIILPCQEPSIGRRDQGTSAPPARERFLFWITRPGSISRRLPIPVQDGQAPWGELKLKLRGSSSSTVVPSYGQLYRSL